jgi:hypothetical protein
MLAPNNARQARRAGATESLIPTRFLLIVDCLTGPASHPGANFVVLVLDGARIWLRDEKIRRKLAAELKVCGRF